MRFTVVKELRQGDAVAIAKGATVTGVIEKKKSGIFGGKMTLRLIQADAVDGRKLNVRAIPARRADSNARPVETPAKKAKDLAAAAGTEYVAYVDGEQTVNRSQVGRTSKSTRAETPALPVRHHFFSGSANTYSAFPYDG